MISQLSPYLLGEHFTAADILYVHCLDWAESIGWYEGIKMDKENNSMQEVDDDHDDGLTNDEARRTTGTIKLAEYLEKCRQRSGYKRAIERRMQENKLKEEYRKSKKASKL